MCKYFAIYKTPLKDEGLGLSRKRSLYSTLEGVRGQRSATDRIREPGHSLGSMRNALGEDKA